MSLYFGDSYQYMIYIKNTTNELVISNQDRRFNYYYPIWEEYEFSNILGNPAMSNIVGSTSVSVFSPSVSYPTITKVSTSVASEGMVSSTYSSCENYASNPFMRTSTGPYSFKFDSSSEVSIPSLFWSASGSSAIDIQILDSDENEVSWLYWNVSDGSLYGDPPSKNESYSFTVKKKVESYYLEVPLQIDIFPCSIPNWTNWSNSKWFECESGYNLDSSSNTCNITEGSLDQETAQIMGSTAVVATTSVIGVTLVFNYFRSTGSIQSLFTVSEYYQLLWTFLLLKTRVPENVYQTLTMFQGFKLDFGFLQKYLGLTVDSDPAHYIGLQESSESYSKIDINFKSTLFNYYWLVLIVFIVAVLHLIIKMMTITCNLEDRIKDFQVTIFSYLKSTIMILKRLKNFSKKNFTFHLFLTVNDKLLKI